MQQFKSHGDRIRDLHPNKQKIFMHTLQNVRSKYPPGTPMDRIIERALEILEGV